MAGAAGSAPPPARRTPSPAPGAPHPAFPGDPDSEFPSGGRTFGGILIAQVTPGQALLRPWASVSSSAKQGYHVTILRVLSPSEIM